MKRAPVTVEDESGVGVARVVSHSIDFNRQVAAAVAAPLPLGLGVIGQSSTASRTIRRNHGAKAKQRLLPPRASSLERVAQL